MSDLRTPISDARTHADPSAPGYQRVADTDHHAAALAALHTLVDAYALLPDAQVYEERLNRLRAALQETAHALTRLVPLLRTYPRVIRLTRRQRRRELRRYIREHATHRRLWRKRVLVLIDETRLWRGQ